LVEALAELPEDARVDALNEVRSLLHDVSPMRDHPVDLVLWLRTEDVRGNDYNPNVVAPPEMKLLAHSVRANGFTMPVVTHAGNDGRVVVDGFHRHRVASTDSEVRSSTRGRVPATVVRAERADEASRIAATIEHNRARGAHRIDQMSELVRQLHRAGWTDVKIRDELGMTEDEVLRLKQMTGLAELFASREFNEAWAPAD